MTGPDGNPRAAQTRLKPASAIKTGGQRKHDLRIGRQAEGIARDMGISRGTVYKAKAQMASEHNGNEGTAS